TGFTSPIFSQTSGSDCFNRIFNAEAVGHDLGNAYLLMYANLFSYENQFNAKDFADFKKKFQDLFAPLGIYRFDFVNVRKKTADTQAVVMSNDKVVIVAFRGSEVSSNGKFSPAKFTYDWILTDFNFFKKRIIWWGFGVKVHQGFYAAMDVCYDEVKRLIQAHLAGTPKKLWITGHSLGAGIAPLFAYRLAEDGIDIQGIYTYAGPRIGNKTFCSQYRKKFPDHQRWVNNNDLVTKLPLKAMGFQHFSPANNIFADGRLEIQSSEMKGPGKASSHLPMAYIHAIYQLLPLELRDQLPVPPSLRANEQGDLELEKEFNSKFTD
ncbi:MAG: lipase family protein, partial [Candidatus Rifleibacteriota bacterium]